MNKIFQIGFNKCGTNSLCNLFSESGIKSIHWDGGNLALKLNYNMLNGRPLLEGYEDFIFFSDMQCLTNEYFVTIFKSFHVIDAMVPGSQFIFNVRPIDKWILSTKNHLNYWNRLQSLYKITDVESFLKEEWHTHTKNVMEYFKERGNLLIFDIEKDDPSKIVSFVKNYKLDSSRYSQANVTVK